ncbi:MAG: hypothetical protein AAFO83_08410 [Cyanobacteria bacterium J06607_13]
MDFSTQTGAAGKPAYLPSFSVLLAVAAALLAVSCASGEGATDQIAAVELLADTDSPALNAGVSEEAVGADGEPAEPVAVSLERLNLAAGTAYGEVRSRIMAQGWMPYAASAGAAPDVADTTVRKLHELGFEEAQSCSGTGMGFCRFEFTHIDDTIVPQPLLVVITTPSSELYGEPHFYSWRIEENVSSEVASTPSDSSLAVLEANATYAEQNFSEVLYAQIREDEAYCLDSGSCGDVRYLFKDVLMVSSVGEFGSTEMALLPHQPVSRSQAMTYARLLDADAVIDFENSIVAESHEGDSTEPVVLTETFFEAELPEEAAYELGSTRMAQLISSPGQGISRIQFSVVVF